MVWGCSVQSNRDDTVQDGRSTERTPCHSLLLLTVLLMLVMLVMCCSCHKGGTARGNGAHCGGAGAIRSSVRLHPMERERKSHRRIGSIEQVELLASPFSFSIFSAVKEDLPKMTYWFKDTAGWEDRTARSATGCPDHSIVIICQTHSTIQ